MKEVQWIDPDFLAPKDAWDRLSMKEKAAMMKVAVQNGITNLSDIRAKYNEFAEGGDLEGSIVKDNVGYSEWVNSLPDNLKHTDPALYDMLGAYKAGMQPTLEKDGLYHLQSRDPRTGRILKSPIYPTYLQAIATDTSLGYFPIVDDKGNTYTKTWEGNTLFQPEDNEYRGPIVEEANVNANGGNLFRGGGSIVSDRLVDMTIEEEGFNKQPEDIGDGKMTLGSGLTASKWHDLYRKRGNKWSAADNRMAVRQELSDRERWARSNVPNWDNLPDSSKEALLMYKYNYDFNRANSPKLFAALEAGNLPEAARQMDATSKIPKFKKGLTNRRKREQAHFMLGVRPTPTAPSDITLQSPDNTFVYNPYLLQEQNTTMLPQVVPDKDAYVSTHEMSPEEIKAQKLQESFDNINRFNRTMEMLGNNLRIPTFHPTTGNDVLDLLWSTRGNDSPLLQMADEYARGGRIHIKEKNRGKFTRLKERTGKSASWFKAHGTPAQKKMAIFALNSKKWKHGLGGNLFSGEEDHSNQMNIGLNATNGWQPYTLGDIVANGERVARQRKALQDTFLNFPVESNDATAVANGRPQNTHLEGKAVRGGTANAAWEKDHPNLTQWGYLTGITPFAIAAAPLLGGVAETTGGQMVSAGLKGIVDAAKATPYASTLLPWAGAAFNTGMATHGIQELREGNFTPMTALELAPLAPPTVGIANNLYLPHFREHVYTSKSPIGYYGKKEAAKRIAEGVLSGRRADIENPEWFNKNAAEKLQAYAYIPSDIQGVEREQYLKDFGERALKARTDIWRLYNDLPQKFGTYTPSDKYPGAYTALEDIKALKWVPKPRTDIDPGDFVNSTGGNVGMPEVLHLGKGLPDPGNSSKQFGVTTLTDWFDLHPFSRPEDRIINKFIKPAWKRFISKPMANDAKALENLADRLRYNDSEIKDYIAQIKDDEYALDTFTPEMFPSTGIKRRAGNTLGSLSERLSRASRIPEFGLLKPLEQKIADFEIGKLWGGKPVLVKNEIPWTMDRSLFSGEDGTLKFSTKYTQGFNSSNFLPQEVWDWRHDITMPTLSENNFIVDNTLLKRLSNIQTIKR